MSTDSTTFTSWGGGLCMGPLFQSDANDRRVAAYWDPAPGLSISPIYSYIFTPFSSPAPGNYDVAPLQTVPNTMTSGTTTYLTLSNNNYPTSYQYTNPKTNRPALQFDVPRCIQVNWSLTTTADMTINWIGQDGYGFPMLEKKVIPNATAGGNITSSKAFWRLWDIWVSYGAGSASSNPQLGINTVNTFGLPYRLYGKGDIINFGGGYQVLSADNSSCPGGNLTTLDPTTATWADMLLATTQGFFESQLPTYNQSIATPYNLHQTGGPVHVAQGRDVRGTINADAANLMTTSSAAPTTLTFTYVVKGFANLLSSANQARLNSVGNPIPLPGYQPGGTPLPILPNVFYNYPAGQYTPPTGTPADPQRLPLTLNDAMGLPQFYSETPIP